MIQCHWRERKTMMARADERRRRNGPTITWIPAIPPEKGAEGQGCPCKNAESQGGQGSGLREDEFFQYRHGEEKQETDGDRVGASAVAW